MPPLSVRLPQLSDDGPARALSLEQIGAINDTNALREETLRCEEVEIVIRTSLEFPDNPDDIEWRRKARSALISYRIAIRRIELRIKQIAFDNRRKGREAKEAARDESPVL